MAFIHCNFCDWQQDDFWTRRYNPIRRFLTVLNDYWYPRIVHFDKRESYGDIFSWQVAILETLRIIRNTHKMEWYTYRAWRESPMRGCPRCGGGVSVD